MRVLVVADDRLVARGLRDGLEDEGYSVDVVGSADAALAAVFAEPYDLVLLGLLVEEDVLGEGLPGRGSTALCRRLRERVVTPILILANDASTPATVAGLDAGADDYLGRPFAIDELFARLRSLLRRGRASEGSRLRAGDVVLDLWERRVTVGGAPVRLTAKEFALLELMLRNPRRTLTRATISSAVWDLKFKPGSNVIDVYVKNLRHKLAGSATRIETVIGSGYRLVVAGDPHARESRPTESNDSASGEALTCV